MIPRCQLTGTNCSGQVEEQAPKPVIPRLQCILQHVFVYCIVPHTPIALHLLSNNVIQRFEKSFVGVLY